MDPFTSTHLASGTLYLTVSSGETQTLKIPMLIMPGLEMHLQEIKALDQC